MMLALRRHSIAFTGILFVAAALLLLFSSSDSSRAVGNYVPVVSQKLCNGLPATFPDVPLQGTGVTCMSSTPIGTTSAPRTSTLRFNLPSPNLQFSSLVTFEPNTVSITPGCNVDKFDAGSGSDAILDGRDTSGDGVGDGITCLRPGDKVGGARNLVSLGTLGGACVQGGLFVDFYFYNVALPNNVNNPRASTNIYTPAVEGTSTTYRFNGNPIIGWNYGIVDPDDDKRANVVLTDPDNVLVSSRGITRYPDWLLDVFDADWRPSDPPINGPKDGVSGTPGTDDRQNPNDGPKKPLIPLAVYGGITNIAGSRTPLYFVQFDDGKLSAVDNPTDGFTAPHPFSRAVASLGQPSQTVLTDTTVLIASQSTVSDFCSLLISDNMLLGTTLTDIRVRATNPASAGTHAGLAWSTSQRDLDNDGYEAQIDTCAATANTDTDPRSGVDPDTDLVDASCDPEDILQGCGAGYPDEEAGIDCDGDEFHNSQDNCPLIANGLATDNPAWDGQKESENLQVYGSAAADGGPKTDGIGDVCDSEVGTWSGTQNGVATTVTMSDIISNGKYLNQANAMPNCYGGTDADGDGWCATTAGEVDSSNLRHPSLASWTSVLADHDGDGYNGWVESFMGTDDTKQCNASGASNDEPLDARPTDFNDDRNINLLDINIMKPKFFTAANDSPPGTYDKRQDLNADTAISLLDINIMKPFFFTTCTTTPQQ